MNGKSRKKGALPYVSIENLEGMFQTLSEGMALNEMIFDDRMEMTDYRILLVNDAYYDHAGIPVGMPVTGMLASDLYKMDKSAIRSFWESHKNDAKPVTTELTGPVDNKRYRITISPFRDGLFVTAFQNIPEASQKMDGLFGLSGEPVRMFGTLRDIGEFNKAELLLRESEKRYHSLFNMSMDAMLLTVPDGEILAANSAACRMFDRTEEEMTTIGRSGIMDLTDPLLPKALEKRKKTGNFSGELSFIRKNGEKFPGEMSSSVFMELDGESRTIIVIRDISGRKAAEQAIRSLLEEKELILKEVHHRIKNNMSTIYGLLVMQAQTVADAAARSALEDARNRVHSMIILYEKCINLPNLRNCPSKNTCLPLSARSFRIFPPPIRSRWTYASTTSSLPQDSCSPSESYSTNC